MAKITRKHQKILGSNSANTGQFGSAREGTFVLSNDPDVIQGLSAWENGLLTATMTGENLPAAEEMQGVYYVVTRQLAYLLQQGVPEWDAAQEYYEDGFASEGGVIYVSLQDNNIGNAVTDGAWWTALSGGGLPDGDYGDVEVSDDGTTITIKNSAVTNAKQANMTQATIKGRASGAGTGAPQDLTASQARTAMGLGTAATQNVGTAAGNVVQLDATGKLPAVDGSQLMNISTYKGRTVINASGQAALQFVDIPDTANEIVLVFSGIITSGTSIPLLQIGDESGWVSTGYIGRGGYAATVNASTAGIPFSDNNVNGVVSRGRAVWNRVDDDTWVCVGQLIQNNGNKVATFGGEVTLSNALDRVRLMATNGTDTFNSGSITMEYR